MDRREFETNINFNSIWVIESLPESELKEVNELIEYLKQITDEKNIGFFVVKVTSKEELIYELKRILNFIDRGLSPIIHMAMHGSVDGLTLLKERISWAEIEPYFSEINLKVKNNLLITLAVCYGSHTIDFYKLNTKRAPFFGFIAPKGEINAKVIDDTLKKFYQNFFDIMHASKAFKKSVEGINSQDTLNIIIMDSTSFIVPVLKIFVEKIRKGQKRHDLIKAYEKLCNNKMPYELKNKIQYPEDILALLKPEILEILYRYVMVDISPVNYERLRIAEIEKYIFEL